PVSAAGEAADQAAEGRRVTVAPGRGDRQPEDNDSQPASSHISLQTLLGPLSSRDAVASRQRGQVTGKFLHRIAPVARRFLLEFPDVAIPPAAAPAILSAP